MTGPTTNARVRNHFENRPSSYAETVSPGNGATTTVSATTRAHVVNPDGTNSVDLDDAARQGHRVTIVHNGGSNTPTLSFDDADFVGTGPSDLTTAGETATLLNTDGNNDGWVVVATGSA